LAEGRATFLASDTTRLSLQKLCLSEENAASLGVQSLPPWSPGMEPPPRTGTTRYPLAASAPPSGSPAAATATASATAVLRTQPAPLGLPMLLPPPSTTKCVTLDRPFSHSSPPRRLVRCTLYGCAS